MYPETYSAGMDGTPGTADDFAGMDVTGLASFGFAGRVGAQVKIGPMVRLGATYTSESTIELDGGNAKLNFGQMNVNYDAELAGLHLAAGGRGGHRGHAGEGAHRRRRRQVDQLVGRDRQARPEDLQPRRSGRADGRQRDITFDMAWEDQWVYAIGVEYAFNDMHTLRAGYNYGKSPVPDDNLNPLFPAIVEQHVTLGYGLTLGQWAVNLAYEHAFENTQVNNNANQQVNSFGPGLEVSHSQNTVSLEATYRY